jgi:hypothetical protein
MFEKFLVKWLSGNPRFLGGMLITIFTGYTKSGTGMQWLFNIHWTLLYPLLLFFSLVTPLISFLKKFSYEEKTVSFLFLLLFLHLNIFTLGYLRYGLLILPFMITLTVTLLSKIKLGMLKSLWFRLLPYKQ